MRPALLALCSVVAVVALAAIGGGAWAGSQRAPERQVADAGTFVFAAGTHPLDQQAVRDAVARAQPAARQLIARVDGLTRIRVGAPVSMSAAGVTQPRPDGGYDVELDLGGVSRALGVRGITRLVLHELGHVIDHEILPPDLARRLDAGIPAGYPCGTPGAEGSCVGRSAREERFAETFAKWAADDIGVALDIGYKVPPPSASLEAWGAPLGSLVPATGRGETGAE